MELFNIIDLVHSQLLDPFCSMSMWRLHIKIHLDSMEGDHRGELSRLICKYSYFKWHQLAKIFDFGYMSLACLHHIKSFSPLARKSQLTVLKNACTETANARKLAFSACLYINCHSIKTIRPTGKLFIYYYSL